MSPITMLPARTLVLIATICVGSFTKTGMYVLFLLFTSQQTHRGGSPPW